MRRGLSLSIVMVLPVSSVGMAWAGGSHHHGNESTYWWAIRTGLAAGSVLGTVDAREAGWERRQRDDHASRAWMSASAHQGPGTPVR